MNPTFQVTFDCTDPARLSSFWALALGYKLQDPPEGHPTWEEFLSAIGVPEEEWNSASAIVDPDGVQPRVYFQRVPEPKTVKNRVHMDLNVGGGRDVSDDERRRRIGAEIERLQTLGATVVRPLAEERGEWWAVLQDPEGNEFCLQ